MRFALTLGLVAAAVAVAGTQPMHAQSGGVDPGATPAALGGALPAYVAEFGEDVAFWHRPAGPDFAAVLNDFVHLEASVQQWHEPSFDATLQEFEDRFAATGTEEGTIMATTLRYVHEDLRTSRRAAILDDFRTSGRILQLFQQGVRELGTLLPGSN